MAQQQRRQVATAVEGYREGSRWVHVKPSGEELAEWFTENVQLHDGLRHKDYVQGIVLIPQKEKFQETGANGEIADKWRLVFTPHPTTSARIRYFEDWAAVNGYLKVLEPDRSVARMEALPPGYFRYSVSAHDQGGREKVTNYIGYSATAAAYERDFRAGGRGREVLTPHSGAKVVPVLRYAGSRGMLPDENALMKAQTGGKGRALGFAGMLVIPGTGVATAEDVQEALGQPAAGSGEPTASLPADEPSAAPQESTVDTGDPRTQVAVLIGALQKHPKQLEEAKLIAKDRDMNFDELSDKQVRGAVRLLEKKLAEGEGETTPDADKPKT